MGGTERPTEESKNKNKNKNREEETLMAAPAAAYAEILKVWQETFPEKPQPRTDNKTLQGKTKTRINALHFQENWKGAMSRAGQSQFLRNGSWFTLQWFLKNDDNYEKCLSGNYDDGQNYNGQLKPEEEQQLSGGW